MPLGRGTAARTGGPRQGLRRYARFTQYVMPYHRGHHDAFLVNKESESESLLLLLLLLPLSDLLRPSGDYYVTGKGLRNCGINLTKKNQKLNSVVTDNIIDSLSTTT